MVLPTIVLVLAALVGGVYWFFGTRRPATVIRTALYVGCIVGALRAVLASAGWYVVEHTGGPLQVPGYALAMLAWPEGMLINERRTTTAPPAFYVQLSLLLFASTVLLIVGIAIVARPRQATQPARK
jgi:uncharacterized membrane protein